MSLLYVPKSVDEDACAVGAIVAVLVAGDADDGGAGLLLVVGSEATFFSTFGASAVDAEEAAETALG